MPFFQELKNFVDTSTTSITCADTIQRALEENGFTHFEFVKDKVPKGKKIFIRHKGFIGAFCLPKELKSARYLLAHTDSPCFKLKPKPIVKNQNMTFLVCEPYGSPLLSSYLGHPLKLAGQIALKSSKGIEIRTVESKQSFIIPDPAIHLSKEANASLDKNKIHALVCIDEETTLEALCNVKEPIVAHDLFLVSGQSLSRFGLEKPFYSGPRLDNLSSCFALLETLKEAKPLNDTLLAGLFFDHEEIGSETMDGAKSHYFTKRLKRLIEAYEPEMMLDERSHAFSLDVAHANHPSYPDKFDLDHPVLLNGGIVIKHHAQHRYAQDLKLFAYAKSKAPKSQIFTMRNEVGTGSTLGPYFTSVLSIPTQDIGLAVLSMHSTSEIIAENDLENLVVFLKEFFHGQ